MRKRAADAHKRDALAAQRDRIADERTAADDARDALAAERDRIADERDAIADERESTVTDRQIDVDLIFEAADHRDDRAQARDQSAGKRDVAATLNLGLHDDATWAVNARTLAQRDRRHSKDDRSASEVDRYALCDDGPTATEYRAALDARLAAAVERLEAQNARQQAAHQRDLVKATAQKRDQVKAKGDPSTGTRASTPANQVQRELQTSQE